MKQEKLTVEGGKITLPPSLRPLWEHTEIAIREISTDRIILERLTPKKKRLNLKAWKQAAGILKGRIPDPVKWQKEIRKEWDRELPKGF